MQKLINFWKKDLLNKLILLTGAALIVGIFLLVYLLVTMPEKSLFMETYFPNLGSNSGLPTLAPPPVTPTSPPTPTTKPFPTLPETVAPTTDPAGATPEPTPTPAQTVTQQPTQLPALPGKCIPANPAETGRVVEVLDGNTIRVLMADKVYVVRYIGLAVQPDGNAGFPFGTAATLENGRLVYGKDIQLVRDTTDKDPNGRLLRYVSVGDVFINFEMVYRGLGTASDTPPDSACAAVLAAAEQQARAERKGQWAVAPTP